MGHSACPRLSWRPDGRTRRASYERGGRYCASFTLRALKNSAHFATSGSDSVQL